jgi:3-oxoacyl-[acyl-carrier protein] reductase
MPDRGFEGETALITGGAQGLGLGIARTLIERGADVVLADIDGDRLVEAVTVDVSQREEVERMVAEAERGRSHVDILVNNAGVLVVKKFEDYEDDDWDRVMDVKRRGVYLCPRICLPGMIRAERGNIINLASISAFHTTTTHVSYAATKAAVVALTRDVAYEVAPYGIRVNGVAPGAIATPMTASLDTGINQAIGLAVPMGHWGDPSDIAATVAFLASPEARFITGVTIPVAGGSDLRLQGFAPVG